MLSSYCHFHTRPYFLIQSAVVNQSSAAISVEGNCYCRQVWLACSMCWVQFFFQVLFSTTRFSSVLSCEYLFISSPQCKYMNFIYLKSSFITWMVYLDPAHISLLDSLVIFFFVCSESRLIRSISPI